MIKATDYNSPMNVPLSIRKIVLIGLSHIKITNYYGGNKLHAMYIKK